MHTLLQDDRTDTRTDQGSSDTCHQLRMEYLKGATYKALAEKYQIDQRTARRYVQLNLPFEEYEHRPYKSVLTAHKHFIRKWVLEEGASSACIHRRLLEAGCQCSYSLVNRFVQQIRKSAPTPAASKDTAYISAPLNHRQLLKTVISGENMKTIIDKGREEKIHAQHKHR